MSLLNVNDLSVSFVTRNGTTEAVKNVSFSVEAKSITPSSARAVRVSRFLLRTLGPDSTAPRAD